MLAQAFTRSKPGAATGEAKAPILLDFKGGVWVNLGAAIAVRSNENGTGQGCDLLPVQREPKMRGGSPYLTEAADL